MRQLTSSHKLFIFFLIFLLVLEILDFSFTTYLLNHDSTFSEGNPLVARFIENGYIIQIFALKLLIPVFLMLFAFHILEQDWISKAKWFLKFMNVSWIGLILLHFIVVVKLGWWIWL